MTWNWTIFALGFLGAVLIGFGAIVGWWFLIVTRHKPKSRVDVDVDVREIRKFILERRRS